MADSDIIKIPTTASTYLECKEFSSQGGDELEAATKEVGFKAMFTFKPKIKGKPLELGLWQPLAATQKAGYRAMFMPDLIDARLNTPLESRLWQSGWTTPSIRALGSSRRGTTVAVYAHVDNYFSNPENIRSAIRGQIDGAGIMPQDEFHRLLDLEDNKNVFVVDYYTLRDYSMSGPIFSSTKTADRYLVKVREAIKHPQTIPFLGGKKRAEKYLEQHMKNYGEDSFFNMPLWYMEERGIDDYMTPKGRLLYLGFNYDMSFPDSTPNVTEIETMRGFDMYGHYLGVRQGADTRKSSDLEQTLKD